MPCVHVFGIDLSGPANPADTALACFVVEGDDLVHVETRLDVDDDAIVASVADRATAGPVVVGLDAPLSYAPGGGDREADRRLRELLVATGLPPGTVMTPTMTRMAYLTLRGITVARSLELACPSVEIVEVHPAGVLVLHGAPAKDVAALKKQPAARECLARWLAAGLRDLPLQQEPPVDHVVAAWAAALGTFRWRAGRSAWIAPATPPHHPFDYCC